MREGRRSAWAPVCRGDLAVTAYGKLRGLSVGFRIAQRPVLRAGLCMVFLAAALFCAPAPLWAEVTATGDGNPSFTGTEPDPWTVSGEIRIGNTGTGTLTIADGGSVSNIYGYLGYSSTGDGTATVTGTASSWTNTGHLYVGESGTGTLTVADGGSVTSVGLYLGGNESTAGGTAAVSVLEGGTLSVGIDTKIYAGSTLTLSGAASTLQLGGSLTNEGTFDWQSGGVVLSGGSASWDYGASDFTVGDTTPQSFTLQGGAEMSNGYSYVGKESGSSGTATVTGNDSSWDNSGGLYIGGNESSAGGTAAVSVLDGGTLSVSGDTKIYAGSTLTLSGAASRLELRGSLTNEGTFDWQSGGVVLNGASASWDDGASDFTVGDTTTQSFTLQGGAEMSNGYGYVGRYSGGDGTATVTGTDSSWTNANHL